MLLSCCGVYEVLVLNVWVILMKLCFLFVWGVSVIF